MEPAFDSTQADDPHKEVKTGQDGDDRSGPAIETVHARETTRARRDVDAFAGGFLILFGARLAGGCTSGHVLSGVSQLAISGMVFAAGVFASGIVVARSLYGRLS